MIARPLQRWISIAALACCVLAGCDQFARVGVQDVASAGTSPVPEPDAAVVTDAGTDAGADAGAECPDVDVAICNPVKNEGCPGSLSMQCAIDLTKALGGYCTFYAAPLPTQGADCLNTGVTESCPPTTTCFATRCHTICLCDADCDAGQCCNEPIGTTSFSVCTDC